MSINRSSLYVKWHRRDDSELCNVIAEIYSNYPIYGYRRVTAMLARSGYNVNHKRVSRLMRGMNLRAIYPGPNTSKRNFAEMVHPYLLSDLVITKVNMVWQVDITYLRTNNGFMYLVSFIDMYSRVIMGFRLSNSLCTRSAINALEDAILKHGRPEIINSDQGSQFTSEIWINKLQQETISLSMTGKGRCTDNANIERLWRSFKYEGSYLYKWNSVLELKQNIPKWINWYNHERPHQGLNYLTPWEVKPGYMDKIKNLSTYPHLQQLQKIDRMNL